MKVLVTGGAGFLGANLCEFLLSAGHKVVCADNFSSGQHKNVQRMMVKKNFTFKKWDITRWRNMQVDWIFNLACPASPPFYQADPIGTTRACTEGVYNLMKLAHANRARLLQTSTSEVYGDPEVHPQVETYWGHVNPGGIRSCYDEGKRCAESIILDFQRKYGTDSRIVRIFNTYGPYMRPDDGRVVSNLVCQALKGEPMTIYGDGTQTRSFCYVDDQVQGLYALMQSECRTPVNIGNPEEVTMIELAGLIKEITGTKSEIIFQGLPKDDPCKRKPDITKAGI
jgi:UDP-glucuronate decarboxylase